MKSNVDFDQESIRYMNEFSTLAQRIAGETGLAFETVADMGIGQLTFLKAMRSAAGEMDYLEEHGHDPKLN